MSSRGGKLSHTYEVAGTLDGYFWVCTCGTSSSASYDHENAAIAGAEKHVAEAAPPKT